MLMMLLLAAISLIQACPDEAGDAHYDIRAHIDPAGQSIAVDMTVATTRGAAEAGYLLNGALAVEADEQLVITPDDSVMPGLQRIVLSDSDAPDETPVTLTLRYAGRLTADVIPYPQDRITPGAVELSVNSVWLPVRADLGSRFTADAEITGLPAEFELAGPGAVARTEAGWRIDRSFPDLDLAFVAQPGLRAGADGVLYAVNPDTEEARFFAAHSAAALDYFETLFGPSPGCLPRLVLIEREAEGGYARRGYIVLTSDEERGALEAANFAAHEIAHGWWLAAEGTGAHHWLIESVAEYVTGLYLRDEMGEAAYQEQLAFSRARAQGAVFNGETRPDHAALYHRGPLILTELENRIGREAVLRVLNHMLEAEPRGTGAFLDAIEVEAGGEARTAFETALRQED